MTNPKKKKKAATAKAKATTTRKAAPAKTTAKATTAKKAPAKKAATKKSPAESRSTPASRTALRRPTVRRSPAQPEVAAPAPAPAAAVRIVVKFDAGFGNSLHLRGSGAGLDWDQGVPMRCTGRDEWVLDLAGSADGLTVKVLINDQHWCLGADLPVRADGETVLTPEF